MSRGDADIAPAFFAGYVIGQFMPLFNRVSKALFVAARAWVFLLAPSNAEFTG